MNTDGNLEALRRHEDEQERNEARYNRSLKDFRESMDDAIDILVGVFKSNATMSSINRNELKAILLEDLEEML
jgi:hypothetical protein